MSTAKFDNITDLSDYFQGQMIALIEYSTALKKQSDSQHDCLVHVQLKAQIQQARIEGLERSISILTRQLFEHFDTNKSRSVSLTLILTF
jgi:tRNA A37 threonylcarbamoyladenosine biosynthesis protein TsaE